jgi:hypothetical protein
MMMNSVRTPAPNPERRAILIAAKNFLTSARPQRQRLGDDDVGERGGWVAALFFL